MEKWLGDRPDQPGEFARQWLKDLYQDNKLVKGEFEQEFRGVGAGKKQIFAQHHLDGFRRTIGRHQLHANVILRRLFGVRPSERVERLEKSKQKFEFPVLVVLSVGAGGLAVTTFWRSQAASDALHLSAVRNLDVIGTLEFQTQEARRRILYALATDDVDRQLEDIDRAREADAQHRIERVAFLRKQYGLDKSFLEQYAVWVGVWPKEVGTTGKKAFSGLLQGDWGWSFEHDLPVNQVIGSFSITVFRFESGRGLGTSTLRPPAE